MKISEILNEVTRPPTQEIADEILRNAGYKRIGFGAYGAVYQKNDRMVIKTFSSFDIGYLAFVKMARESKNNPHFPFFFGKPIKISDRYYAIKQENLEPYNGNPTAISLYIQSLIDGIKLGYDNDFEDIEDIIAEYPRFEEACKSIADVVKSNPRFSLDIHKGNIMKRGRTLVFVDPISTPTSNDEEKKLLPRAYRWDTKVKEKPFKMTPEWNDIFAELEKGGIL